MRFWRHQHVFVFGDQVVSVQRAPFPILRFDIFHQRVGVIDTEVVLGVLGTVTLKTVLAKNRRDVAIKSDQPALFV